MLTALVVYLFYDGLQAQSVYYIIANDISRDKIQSLRILYKEAILQERDMCWVGQEVMTRQDCDGAGTCILYIFYIQCTCTCISGDSTA